MNYYWINSNPINTPKSYMDAAVLCNQGHKFNKAQLSLSDIQNIKNHLTAKPNHGADYGDGEAFPVYNETTTDLYVPRYYAHTHYPPPAEIHFENQPIDIQFTGTLKPFQQEILPPIVREIRKKGGGIISLGCGFGKCLAKGTPVLMYDGRILPVEDIQEGDLLMGDDSKPRQVLSLARGREEMFDIIPSKGEKYTVNRSHILSLQVAMDFGNKLRQGDIMDISVDTYLNLPPVFHDVHLLKGYRVPINFRKRHPTPINPYLLGVWLARGQQDIPSFKSVPEPVFTIIQRIIQKIELKISLDNVRHSGDIRLFSFHIIKIAGHNTISQELKRLNLVHNKHIPIAYKCTNRQIRLETLAGLIDASGEAIFTGFQVTTKNETLVDDIIFIARSLGFSANKSIFHRERFNSHSDLYKTYITGNIAEIPTHHIKVRSNTSSAADLTYDIRVKSIGEDDYYGFEIDGNRRFVLGDLSVTHNTVMALRLIAELNLKALVLVHKSFLMDQWRERIEQFTNARVGTIRRKVVDVSNKDIVLGMLQSVSMIDYPPETFADFGVVICDECHHFGSRVFSRVFFKIAPQYTIGLSATPTRGDGMTCILHWFLGDILIRMTRGGDHNIMVKVIRYHSSDTHKFAEKKKYFNGNTKPDHIRMITNLCSLDDRNQLCINVINSLRKQNDRKILVLADRIQHLKTLKPAIDVIIEQEVADGISVLGEYTTGYYIGKMKSYELDYAAEADIIFASYKMAEEALDICKLNTLVFASPIKKLEQSVGRILRKEAEVGDNPPLIVDITDELSIFKKWRDVRLTYYTKNKYNTQHVMAHNDKLVSVKNLLILQGIIKPGKYTDNEIRRAYTNHVFGEGQYELMDDMYGDVTVDNEKVYYMQDYFCHYPLDLDTVFNTREIEEVIKGNKFKITVSPPGLLLNKFP